MLRDDCDSVSTKIRTNFFRPDSGLVNERAIFDLLSDLSNEMAWNSKSPLIICSACATVVIFYGRTNDLRKAKRATKRKSVCSLIMIFRRLIPRNDSKFQYKLKYKGSTT